jgi:putative nucleotidyltransferase with HDIG domain
MDHKTIVKAVTDLPTPSAVYRRICEVMDDPDSSVADISEVLKLDPAISSKVLRLANSAYTGIPNTVSSLHNAIVLLGTKKIQSLVIASGLLSVFRNRKITSFSLEQFWKHSVTVALISESIAKHLKRYGSIDENEAFSGAILHDIGKLVIGYYYPDILSLAYEKSIEEKIAFFQAEEDLMSHFKIGEMLAEHWSFPPDLKAVISFHHFPDKAQEHLNLISIVHVSDVMVHILGCPIMVGEIDPLISEAALKAIELPPERLSVIAEHAIDDRKRLETILQMFSSQQ